MHIRRRRERAGQQPAAPVGAIAPALRDAGTPGDAAPTETSSAAAARCRIRSSCAARPRHCASDARASAMSSIPGTSQKSGAIDGRAATVIARVGLRAAHIGNRRQRHDGVAQPVGRKNDQTCSIAVWYGFIDALDGFRQSAAFGRHARVQRAYHGRRNHPPRARRPTAHRADRRRRRIERRNGRAFSSDCNGDSGSSCCGSRTPAKARRLRQRIRRGHRRPRRHSGRRSRILAGGISRSSSS